MRILISYDGSEAADAALRDLQRAGLPRKAEVIVISIAEWLNDDPGSHGSALASVESVESVTERARNANAMIKGHFPEWNLRVSLAIGSSARVIIKKAQEWKADLIVLNALKQSWLSREVLGAAPLRIAVEAGCAIRVAANSAEMSDDALRNDGEHRLLICIDETAAARNIIQAVAGRVWPRGTEARLLTVVNPFDYSLVPLLEQKIERVKRLHRSLGNELDYTPLYVSSAVREGEVEKTILREAEEWRPSAIFIGTGERSILRPFAMGMLTHGVISNAICPVELVRRPDHRWLSSWFRASNPIVDPPASRESI